MLRFTAGLVCVALLAPFAARAADDAPLTVMLSEPPRTMDPADQNATETASVLEPFYETLLKRDARGTIQPGLATSWRPSADRLVWTFSIRPGVRFHDGAPCDAAAVTRSLQRLIDRKVALAGASVYRAVIASVRQDGETVVVTLARPYADFLSLVTLVQSAIVSPVAVEAGELSRRADGTGPFRFVSWRAGEDVFATRNSGYWGVVPAIAAIDWRWSPEPSVLNMALQTGDADVVIPLAPVFARVYAPGQSAAALATVKRQRSAALFWLALNTRLKPLDDARVRRALGLAIDRRALVAGLLDGFGAPACHALTPDIPDALPCGAGEDRARIDMARALLKEAGQEKGFSVSVVVQEPEEPIAEALQAMWRPLGVVLSIRRQEAGVWVQSAFAPPEEKAREETGMALTSWSAPYVSDLQLRPLYTTGNSAPHGANLGFYNNADIDRMIDAAAQDNQPASRHETLLAIQSTLDRDAPIVPLFTRDTLYGVRNGISGVWAATEGSIRVVDARRAQAQ
ncbi:ABC transporter substrate-binding protein [Acetobacter nitrogenifigens]|uniref:Glycosyl transferase n=1 Tax=Acetobacter nitrogenifigens DSM 23921 = NBRC 105050 TaxID=1120919 RepID=A0A511XCN8_9PROT|nr:ABC transporter substrate-binding protein [Acetobacter nitrogenifigens]GEN60702.1 glycosyl transferase [Acetobacter nitrogenifigens DSM 23921 = NBRC 105050]